MVCAECSTLSPHDNFAISGEVQVRMVDGGIDTFNSPEELIRLDVRMVQKISFDVADSMITRMRWVVDVADDGIFMDFSCCACFYNEEQISWRLSLEDFMEKFGFEFDHLPPLTPRNVSRVRLLPQQLRH